MKVNANTLRPGHVIEHNNKLWVVIRSQIMIPGKGAAVVHIDMRDARTGTKSNERFRTQETVEKVRLEEAEMQYLFNDGETYTFMNNENYEQLAIAKDIIGDGVVYLQDGMICTVRTHEGAALSVELPETVVCEIIEADPVVKGQTASSSYKPAKLDNGLKVMVPPHIESGTKIVVRTSDNEYLERYKG